MSSYCMSCDGTGTNWAEHDEDGFELDCEDCDGTGEVDDEEEQAGGGYRNHTRDPQQKSDCHMRARGGYVARAK